MTLVTVPLDPEVHRFYTRIAQDAGLPLSQVLSDALFLLAGELSLEALAGAAGGPAADFFQKTL